MQQRKYFGTDGIRGRVGDYPVNAEFMLKLGWAIGKVLAREGGGKVLIGKDTRISGYIFESALEAGLASAGVDIHLLGPMPTPAIAYLTRTLRAQAGIVISASHNLYQDNGIKFFSAQGSKLPDELEVAIEAQLDQPMVTVDSAKLGKAVRIVDAPGRYIEFCKSTVPSNISLKGLKIVVDCANGATYYIAPNVFRELGAEVIEIATEPDGFNINRDCGSTAPQVLQAGVLEHKADLGIALDGDGDRLIMVDAKGEILDGDELLFILIKDRLAMGSQEKGIVGTVMSNLGLELAIKKMGLQFVRSRVGDRYVLSTLQEEQWLLGGEPSGHVICLDLTSTGDGIVTALQVLRAMSHSGLSLYELKSGLTKFPQVMINVPVHKLQSDWTQQTQIKQAIAAAEERLGKHGRVLLRPSGTEPLLRVMVEGEDRFEVEKIAGDLAVVVTQELGSLPS
ncbi:phosphoglucosamine mutase [soil metagenome]